MDDRTMLELAAKAAGIKIRFSAGKDVYEQHAGIYSRSGKHFPGEQGPVLSKNVSGNDHRGLHGRFRGPNAEASKRPCRQNQSDSGGIQLRWPDGGPLRAGQRSADQKAADSEGS